VTQPNLRQFLARQEEYFRDSYERFAAFGGPCVYFHQECLQAAARDFLSVRHLEMLYATLAAWGMHRMGDAKTTKTKLTDWKRFSGSIAANASRLDPLRRCSMLRMTVDEYRDVVEGLRPVYTTLDLTESSATVVANSKALHHILPNLIPPIDRQYTVRFLRAPEDHWFNARGGFRPVPLPQGLGSQFELFLETCIDLKRLADRVDPKLFEQELSSHAAPAPKALDNAIVNYVRIRAAAQ
jgi:hypothetical protein